eukprot:TRINITY_DN4005_c0_g1_i1.p1 TRINITY_DN4005_c0_g1~~TRINITY_DN4005_c0_g1_i1.p1  ORF type:complete len:449 (+),score=126.76 TRINITY_DN4005_c0_g1_i1:163-1509(+)
MKLRRALSALNGNATVGFGGKKGSLAGIKHGFASGAVSPEMGQPAATAVPNPWPDLDPDAIQFAIHSPKKRVHRPLRESVPLPSYEVVSTTEHLNRALAQLGQEDASNPKIVGLDTEFRSQRGTTLSLVQLQIGLSTYLIDVLSPDMDTTALTAAFQRADVIYVIHDCRSDVEVLYSHFGTAPCSVFDTQVAASIVGNPPGTQASLQNVLLAHVGVQLPKSKSITRSNWLQRPLTAAQLGYAALDVVYLPKLVERLRCSLQQGDRFAWAQEDSMQLVQSNIDKARGISQKQITGPDPLLQLPPGTLPEDNQALMQASDCLSVSIIRASLQALSAQLGISEAILATRKRFDPILLKVKSSVAAEMCLRTQTPTWDEAQGADLLAKEFATPPTGWNGWRRDVVYPHIMACLDEVRHKMIYDIEHPEEALERYQALKDSAPQNRRQPQQTS